MNLFWERTKARTKGLFQSAIPYFPILPSGDSSPFFGNYEGQKYGGWDTDLCWDFSFTEILETRLKILETLGLIPQSTLDWAKQKGYKDSDGDWYLSRKWEGIISGVQQNGNEQINASVIASQVGMIPNSMLPYTFNPLDTTNAQFVADYFNPALITDEMKALGKEFLTKFTIQAENIDATPANFTKYLQEGSMQVGVPAVSPDWNNTQVNWNGKTTPDHAVEFYKYVPTNKYSKKIYDSYEPHLKELSDDYAIVILTRIVVTAKVIPPTPSVEQISMLEYTLGKLTTLLNSILNWLNQKK